MRLRVHYPEKTRMVHLSESTETKLGVTSTPQHGEKAKNRLLSETGPTFSKKVFPHSYKTGFCAGVLVPTEGSSRHVSAVGLSLKDDMKCSGKSETVGFSQCKTNISVGLPKFSETPVVLSPLEHNKL